MQVEIEFQQHQALQLEQLLDRVNPVAELDVLLGLDGVDLVVLAADEQTGHAQQLEVCLVESSALVDQHVVDQLHAHVHGL